MVMSLDRIYNISVDGMSDIENRDLVPYRPMSINEIKAMLEDLNDHDLEHAILIYLYPRKNVSGHDLVDLVDPRNRLKLTNTLSQLEAKGWIFVGGY